MIITKLTNAISATATSATFDSVEKFPLSITCIIQIDDEKIAYTRATGILNRAQFGTVAEAHATGALVDLTESFALVYNMVEVLEELVKGIIRSGASTDFTETPTGLTLIYRTDLVRLYLWAANMFKGLAFEDEVVDKADFNANTILAADSDDTPAALEITEQTVIGRLTGGNIKALSVAELQTLANVEDGADVTDATNVDAAGAVMESDYNANTILAATTDNTPTAVTINEQHLVGRVTGGNIAEIDIGIGDDDIVQIDAADVADNDYAKFTANGLEGRSYSEVRSDLGVLESIDEDNMASNLDTKVPTQQSVKAYADTKINKSLLTEQGDIIYASAASTPAALAHGTAGDPLLSGGHGANPAWFTGYPFLAELFRRCIYVPVIFGYGSSTKVGSGDGGSYASNFGQLVWTGATNSSSIICYIQDNSTIPGGGWITNIDFSKRRIVYLTLLRYGSAATCIARYQIKSTNAIGAIAAKGIEILVSNLAVYGAGYNTARGETAKLCDLSEYQYVEIMIDHQPSVPSIDFYVNTGSGFPVFGSPTASITASANIPQAAIAVSGYHCVSIEKGAVATDCFFLCQTYQLVVR